MQIVSLKNHKEFEIVNKKGIKIFADNFLLIFARELSNCHIESQPPLLFLGMKVSKKLSKKAVVRNKIKRRIRHLVRNAINNNILDVSVVSGLIVIPKKGFDKLNFMQLNNDFQNNLLKRK